MEYTAEIKEIKDTLSKMKRPRYKFTCEKCGVVYEAMYTKGLCRKCVKKKARKNTRSSNPYGHRIQSTPPKSVRGIQYQRKRIDDQRDDDEQWLSGARVALYDTTSRHHHRYYREGINRRNEIVAEHFREIHRQEQYYGISLRD